MIGSWLKSLFEEKRAMNSNFRTYYRTQDGAADYLFSFERLGDGNWRAYIQDQPSYQSQAEDQHSTHRLNDGTRNYVCWTTPLRTLEEARQVAALWANKTQGYIKTGRPF